MNRIENVELTPVFEVLAEIATRSFPLQIRVRLSFNEIIVTFSLHGHNTSIALNLSELDSAKDPVGYCRFRLKHGLAILHDHLRV